ncbi:MAG TPA: sulfite exporter TauE/SafE family protein [Candidatus Limnocylindrales bacterium]|nr:sulfite exporter TauE/SafE family protein [Candidatus Limnocylindrales bacterium]
MTPLGDGLVLVVGGIATGLFGSLLGLGGGVLIVPLLTLVMGFPLLTAVGVSLICVIVTSGAAAGVYLERRVANLRLGMSLELFTAIGALAGGLIAFAIPERVLEFAFAVLLVYTSLTMLRRREAAAADADVIAEAAPGERPAFVERLSGPGYTVRRLGAGVAGSVGAGVASALLGIGGGLIKVPLMHVVMGVPLRVATATSNLMIGITASASAIVYLLRGGIQGFVAAPSAIGVFIGASIGSRIASRIDLRILRGLFVAILLYTAFQMLLRAIG